MVILATLIKVTMTTARVTIRTIIITGGIIVVVCTVIRTSGLMPGIGVTTAGRGEVVKSNLS